MHVMKLFFQECFFLPSDIKLTFVMDDAFHQNHLDVIWEDDVYFTTIRRPIRRFFEALSRRVPLIRRCFPSEVCLRF